MSIHRAVEILETKAKETMEYASQFRGDKDADRLMSDLAKKSEIVPRQRRCLENNSRLFGRKFDQHHK